MTRVSRTTATEMAVVKGSEIRVSVSEPGGSAGSGPPVLLLPGIGSSVEMWGPLREHLGDRTTIAFDPPGIGASPFDRRVVSIGQMAHLAAAVLDRYAPDVTPDVIGYSFGGLVAQHLARLRVLRRLALVATTAGQPAFPPMPHRLLAMLQGGFLLQQGGNAQGELGQLFGGRSSRESAVLATSMRRLAAVPPSAAGYYGQAVAASVWIGLPWLRLLTMPTLVLCGADDRLVPSTNSRVIAFLAPAARLRILSGAGHLLVIDDAERVGAELRTFLDD